MYLFPVNTVFNLFLLTIIHLTSKSRGGECLSVRPHFLYFHQLLGLPDSFCLTSYQFSLTYFVFLKAFKMHYQMVTFLITLSTKSKFDEQLFVSLESCFIDLWIDQWERWKCVMTLKTWCTMKSHCEVLKTYQTNVTTVSLSGVHNSNVLFLM